MWRSLAGPNLAFPFGYRSRHWQWPSRLAPRATGGSGSAPLDFRPVRCFWPVLMFCRTPGSYRRQAWVTRVSTWSRPCGGFSYFRAAIETELTKAGLDGAFVHARFWSSCLRVFVFGARLARQAIGAGRASQRAHCQPVTFAQRPPGSCLIRCGQTVLALSFVQTGQTDSQIL